MKIVFTIIIVLVWLAIFITLMDIVDHSYGGAAKLLSIAGIIAATYGGYKLIQFIFKKL